MRPHRLGRVRPRGAARPVSLLALGLAVAAVMIVGAAMLGAFAGAARAESPATGSPADTSRSVADSTAANQVVAYYFHTTQRCATCRKIEAYTSEAITAGFPEEIKAGRLVFRPVNIDEEENAHFAKDYALFTKSVILVDERSGKQVAWKNLPKIWELVGDREKFLRYVQEETRGYLKSNQS